VAVLRWGIIAVWFTLTLAAVILAEASPVVGAEEREALKAFLATLSTPGSVDVP